MSTPHESPSPSPRDAHAQPADSPPPPAQRPDAPATPSSVLDILGTIEHQLEYLRKVQRLQDEQSASLTARQFALRQLEKGLDDSIAELRENRAQLEADRQSLETDRRAFDAHWKQFTEQLNLEQQNLASLRLQMQQEQSTFSHDRDEVRNLRAEQELAHKAFEEKMRQESEALNQLASELNEREKALNARAQEVQAAHDRVALAQSQLQVQADQLERSKKEFQSERAALHASLAKAESDLAAASRRTQSLSADLASVREELKSLQLDLSASKDQLADARTLSDSLAADLAASRADRETAASSLIEAQQKLSALSQELDALRQSLHERETTVAQQQEKLSSAGASIAKLSAVIQDQTPLIEQGAAAIALVPQQQEQIDRLSRQVAEASLLADPALIAQKDQRISELTDALREARGMSADAADLNAVHNTNAALQLQVDQLRVESEHARLAAQDAQAQLAALLEAQQNSPAADARIAEYQAKIHELTAALDQLQLQSKTAIQQQADQYESQLRDLNNQVQKLQADADEKLSSLSGEFSLSSHTLQLQHESDQREIAQLRDRLHDLQKKLSAARSSPSASSSLDNDALAAKLKAKAKKITAVAEHLKRRRSRLVALKSLLKRKAAQKTKSSKPAPATDLRRAAQIQHDLEEQRRHLAEARRALAESEKSMLRKWARPSALIAASLSILLTLILAAGSWFAADLLYPPTVAVSSTLDAKSRASKAPESDLNAWLAWNKAELSDPAFHKSLAGRFEERGFTSLDSPESVASFLESQLKLDDSQPGRLILSLHGPRTDETFATLDIITGALITEISRTANRSADTPSTIAPDERRDNGRTRYAAANPALISDPRPVKAAIIFAVAFTALFLCLTAFYTQLKRAKRIFDEQGADLAPAHVIGST